MSEPIPTDVMTPLVPLEFINLGPYPMWAKGWDDGFRAGREYQRQREGMARKDLDLPKDADWFDSCKPDDAR